MSSLYSHNSIALTARERVAGVRGGVYAVTMVWSSESPIALDQNRRFVPTVRHGYRGRLPLDP
jgi:hypothetical protein